MGSSAAHVQSFSFSLPLGTHNLCDKRRQIPEVYLLGAQKSATSSFATDLRDAGVESACESLECNFFTHLHSQWNASFKAALLRRLPHCPQAHRRVIFVNKPAHLRMVPLPEGTQPTGTHWDLPDWWVGANRHASGRDLPVLLHILYGSAAFKLMFIVLLREPLRRMVSAWRVARELGFNFICIDCRAPTMHQALNGTMRRAAQNPPFYDDWLWASMYGRQLEHWVNSFDPHQFYFVPFREYTSGGGSKICHSLADALNINMTCSNFQRRTHDHASTPHAFIERISLGLRRQVESFFSQEMIRLVKVITRARIMGATLAGDAGDVGTNDCESVRRWLETKW